MHNHRAQASLTDVIDTAALTCLSRTNAHVVSPVIDFRCGRMIPLHPDGLELKHVTVHFCDEFVLTRHVGGDY